MHLQRSILCSFLVIGAIVSAWGFDPAPNVPEPLTHDESRLLADARAVEPVLLEGGYRQYDIRVARVSTWDSERDLVIRVWLPAAGIPGPYNLAAFIHGGGFIGGDPLGDLADRESGFAAGHRALLDDGFAVVSLAYRLAREAGWPAPVRDTATGLRFLVEHGTHWDIDTEAPIGVYGHSAGARIAALLGLVDQDDFHMRDAPWSDTTLDISAVWMWAGSALTGPDITEFEAFGRPLQSSVPRLLFGEHPAWNDNAKSLLRIRNTWPHLSMNMPALHMLRGRDDYRGDHTDAEYAVRVWRILGAPAELSIVDGGHSASGDPEDLVGFMRSYVRDADTSASSLNRLEAVDRLIDGGFPIEALEVLNRHVERSGSGITTSQWLTLIDSDSMVLLPESSGLSRDVRERYQTLRNELASRELTAAQRALSRNQYYRASEAVRNVTVLTGADADSNDLIREIENAVAYEETVFSLLDEANRLLHDGNRDEALAVLSSHDDERVREARSRLLPENQSPTSSLLVEFGFTDGPSWADAGGVDVYGRWAAIDLGHGERVRFRFVAPGSWELPEHLWYRNTQNQDFVTAVETTSAFWLAESPITIGQWNALDDTAAEQIFEGDDSLPVTGARYFEIADWLEALDETHPRIQSRLPDEHEWLIAGSAGGRLDSRAALDLHAIHAMSLNTGDFASMNTVGLLPDLAGFVGMTGGVQEWTRSPGPASAHFDIDGVGHVMAYPIARGGAWSSMPHVLGPGIRVQQRHTNRQQDLGFRPLIAGSPEDCSWLDTVLWRGRRPRGR